LPGEVLPFEGMRSFLRTAVRHTLGGSRTEAEIDRVVSTYTQSSTGAYNLLSEYISKFSKKPVYLSNTTSENLKNIFLNRGIEVKEYRYYD
jgi:aspartate/tyrosine/aromatic aminotransferase